MKEKIAKNKFSKNDYGQATNMSLNEKTISFLNRYYVFKKIREVNTDKLKLELTEYSDNQILLNSKASKDSRLNPDEPKSSKLKKTKSKIILRQATDSGEPKITAPKKLKAKKKIIIEED